MITCAVACTCTYWRAVSRLFTPVVRCTSGLARIWPTLRDWRWVVDHASAIDEIYHKGKVGETYNIGGNNEWKNIDLIKLLCRIMDKKLDREEGESEKLITYVKDRAGHDLRYAIDSSKLQKELGWKPSLQFEEGLQKTVDWYIENTEWLENVTSGDYQKYYEEQYVNR